MCCISGYPLWLCADCNLVPIPQRGGTWWACVLYCDISLWSWLLLCKVTRAMKYLHLLWPEIVVYESMAWQVIQERHPRQWTWSPLSWHHTHFCSPTRCSVSSRYVFDCSLHKHHYHFLHCIWCKTVNQSTWEHHEGCMVFRGWAAECDSHCSHYWTLIWYLLAGVKSGTGLCHLPWLLMEFRWNKTDTLY